MRIVQAPQLVLGETDPSQVEFDPRSRDQVAKVLIGLQQVYRDEDCRLKIINELQSVIPEYKNAKTGRNGMDLWKILVLGVIRLGCGIDYDTLKDYADHHRKMREMMGHSRLDDKIYPLQTIKDNVDLLDEETLTRISRIAVQAGHAWMGVSETPLEGRCDSFVVESNVHFPTDINLLLDAMRCSMRLVIAMVLSLGITGWRKGKYNIEQIRKAFLTAQRLKRSRARSEKKKEERRTAIRNAHLKYIELCEEMIERIVESMNAARDFAYDEKALVQIDLYVGYARQQIDLIRRRVLNGETIPHDEKIFSVFEEYTEWISKGKAGVPQELGLKLCILTDQFGFILQPRVMQNEEDVDVAVPVVKDALSGFDRLHSCSFDQGFHSPENQTQLAELLDRVILPKKGGLSQADRERQQSAWFREGRRRHSAVESSINGLEHTGLDRCPDRGLPHFKRYIAWAVLARNLHTLGAAIQKSRLERLKKAA